MNSLLKNNKTIARSPTPSPLLLAGNKLNDNELNTLGDLIGEQDIEPLLQAANSDREDAQAARRGAGFDADGPPRHQPRAVP